MTIRRTLLAGAGLGALALCATPTLAKAPAHHKASSANANSALLAQLKALQEQVADLSARLNVQEAAQRETVANVNTAQSAATTAATQAAQAQTAASAAQVAATDASKAATKAVPAAVKTELATFSKGKWWDSTTVSGRMYFNFSSVDTKINGAKPAGSNNGTGFNIKRFYLGVDHTFSPIFSGNVTMDVSNVVGSTNTQNVVPNSGTAPANATALVGKGFYIKKAYLQAKLNPAFIIRLGSADLPWIPYAENQYGYRHIENTLADRTNFGTSADWGVHVLGDLAGGLFSYQVSVIDGGGYRNVKVSNSVDVEGRLSMNYKGFYAAIGGYSGDRGNNTEGAATPHTASRENAMVGYKNKLFNVGVEYFHAKDWNNVTTVAEDKSDGYSAFGNVNFAKTWSVFGKYEWVKPNKISNDNLKDQYYNVGIQWEPVKIVDLALVYKHDNVKNGTFGTQNGTIGGANPTGSLTGGKGNYNEIGLFGQLRF
jgi:nucleoid-associated protein YgaU